MTGIIDGLLAPPLPFLGAKLTQPCASHVKGSVQGRKNTKDVVICFYFFLEKRRCAASEVANYKIGAERGRPRFACEKSQTRSLCYNQHFLVRVPYLVVLRTRQRCTQVLHKLGLFSRCREIRTFP